MDGINFFFDPNYCTTLTFRTFRMIFSSTLYDPNLQGIPSYLPSSPIS